MEEITRSKFVEFLCHITFFAGMIFMAGIVSLALGVCQVQWKIVGSERLTAINAPDTDQIAQNIAVRQERDTKPTFLARK